VSRPERLDDESVEAWLTSHPAWRRRDVHLVRDVKTSEYPGAARLVDAQVEIAQRLNHHPLITLGYNAVSFELWTHDRGGITQLDLEYGQALDELIAADFADVVLT
jgi:4a-hydroxytetrahydrobiopterin dehydratase